MNDTTTPAAKSVTKAERTNTSVITQRDTSASTQTTIAEFVTSHEVTLTLGATSEDLSSLVTTQLPSTLDENADGQHQSSVVLAGNSFSLQCSSAVEATFRWRYCPFGSRGWKTIYSGIKITTKFHLLGKANVSDCNARACTLNVDNVQIDDAGYFACTTQSTDRHWSVTVLGKPIGNY